MGHRQDYWEDIRTWLIPKLGKVVQFLEDATGEDYYVESETHNTQFVGRVPMPEEEFEEVLHDLGFERNPLASLKHLGSGETEEGSWRKVGFEDYPDRQLHVILYDGDNINNSQTNCTYVYAHWEMRWDSHPIKHYIGVDYNAKEGVVRMKKMLDEEGISYEYIRP